MRTLFLQITGGMVLVAVAMTSPRCEGSILAGDITPGTNTLNDRDRERLVGDADTMIEVGEILEAILIVDNLDNASFAQEDLDDIHGPNYQLTAHVRLMVDSVSPPNMNGISTFSFSGGFGDGSLVKVYEETSGQDTSFGDPAATTIAEATDSPLILTLGFGEADDFWTAEGPVDISLIGALGSGFAAAYNFGLSVLGMTDIPIVPNGEFSAVSGSFHDIVGFGQAFAIASNPNGWHAATDTTISFQGPEGGIIPEPSAAMVWGCILFGAVGCWRFVRRPCKIS
jgi:hypothetical protein